MATGTERASKNRLCALSDPIGAASRRGGFEFFSASDRRARFALGALVVLMLASLVWLVHPWFEASDDTHDAAIYVACAKSIVNGEGYAYLGVPFKIRPPGISFLIAPLIRRGMHGVK